VKILAQTIFGMGKQTVSFAKKGSPYAESFVQEYIANQKQKE
jgi:hypothetical protein